MREGPRGEVVETAREARQGYLGRPVLVVLVASLGLAVVILALLWAGGFFVGRS